MSHLTETETLIYILHSRNTLETKISRNTQDIGRLNTTLVKLMAGSGREKFQFISVFWRPNLLVITQIKGCSWTGDD